MKKILLISFILVSCTTNKDLADEKQIVMMTEIHFAQAAQQKGIAAAFYEFADDSAVIKRGSRIFKGKEAIKNFYANEKQEGELTWFPTFADVSGDLAYTYGEFLYVEKDSMGKVNELKGIFHTVWKKQKDGSWKFVWD